jgi:hypothetical protein
MPPSIVRAPVEFIRAYVKVLKAHGIDVSVRPDPAPNVICCRLHIAGFEREHRISVTVTEHGATAGRRAARQVLREIGWL